MFVFHLILPYAICFAAQDNISPLHINDITKDIISSDIKPDVYRDNLNALLESEANSTTSDILKWFSYMEILVKSSNKALKNIHKNIKNNDHFDPNFKRLIDELFSNKDEYEYPLQSELRKIMGRLQFDVSKETVFETMNLTNSLLEKVVSNNLNQMIPIMPTKWYKNLKDKLIKQEVKAAAGYIAKKMCDIGVCKEPIVFSDYVKIWLRYLLNLKPLSLHDFLTFVPDALERHKHFVKSNVRFRRTVKYILNSDVTTQKDCLAFLDDILDDSKIISTVPNHAQRSATLLSLLFDIIDDNYDVNDDNKRELQSITDMFGELLEEKNVYVPGLLDRIMENLQINNKIWTLNEQSKLDNLWAEIIH